MTKYDHLSDYDLQILMESSEDVPPVGMNNTSSKSVYNKVKSLNSARASCRDGISDLVLKGYAETLASPISNLVNASFIEQTLLPAWKRANITSIPKVKSFTESHNLLRPILLTPAQSKIVEVFAVEAYVSRAILSVIDPSQFGGIPRSSVKRWIAYFLMNRR